MDPALAELGERIRAARASHRALMIRGGGTRLFYGSPLPAERGFDWLDVSGWRGVVDYAPSELVLTARAGTPLAQVEATLAEHGQMLAFEPPRFGAADTLGGCIATALAGPRRMATGPVGDFVLGTRVLDHDGKLLRFGGEVMKNVAGYDVSRLFAGSFGALGVVTEVSLKVIPRPRAEATRALHLDEDAALAACLGWRSQPLPVSATAWSADPDGRRGRLTVRLSGDASAVRAAGTEIGGEEVPVAEAQAFWTSLRDQTAPFFQQRPLWRIALPASVKALGLGPTLTEWGGTLRWLAGPQDAAALRARARQLGGSACLYRRDGADAATATFQPLAPALAGIHRRLKHEFDPDNVFSARTLFLPT